MEEQLIRDNLEQEEANMLDQPAYNDIGIVDKQIEPSHKISKYVSRNQSLGNLDNGEFKNANVIKDEALKLLTIDYDKGGWMGEILGNHLLQRNEGTLVLSGSKDGFVRNILSTKKAVITKENKSKAGKTFGPGIGDM